jgi:S-disulfanyl-L-cysteine oxidoreductase SoxD
MMAIVCVSVCEMALRSASIGAQDSPGSSTGLYTGEQANRGAEVYAHACTHCHRSDLSGNEDGAPPMKGPGFDARWNDRPLSELHFVIKETMPQDEPGTLSDQQCADLLAYILKSNGLPAGSRELPANADALSRIRFNHAGR